MNKKTVRFLLCWVMMVLLGACQNNTVTVPVEETAAESDGAFWDSVLVEEEDSVIDYELLRDGLFDDFIYRFMQDSLFQAQRIDFPLTYCVDGEKRKVEKEEWTYDSVYSSENEYTSIYDGRDTIEYECDPDLKTATVEVVDLRGERVKLYHFGKKGDHWILNEIDEHFFDHDNNHGFFAFYGKFSNDESYQLEHIQDPFYFKTFDAENFQEIEGWVSAELWPDYRTYLPNEKLINTIYEGARPTTPYRRLSIGSPSSGMSCSLLFKRVNGIWKLVSMEN